MKEACPWTRTLGRQRELQRGSGQRGSVIDQRGGAGIALVKRWLGLGEPEVGEELGRGLAQRWEPRRVLIRREVDGKLRQARTVLVRLDLSRSRARR